jgi:predicted metalloprotease with PDZ domain
MLVAFLCDLALLKESKGKRSVTNVFRRIFEKHRFPSERQDGNAAVLSIMQADAELMPIIQEFIKGSGKIDWQTELQSAGIENELGNKRTALRVTEKPTGRQKALLDKLGYNNWRKLSR